MSRSTAINGRYQPVSGDFDGDGFDDIVWYGPGSDPDYLWRGSRDRGRFATAGLEIRGSGYLPVVADLDGDGRCDIFWWVPGAASHPVWFGDATGSRFVARWISL